MTGPDGDGLDRVAWYADALGLLGFLMVMALLWVAWGFHSAGMERIARYERRRRAHARRCATTGREVRR